MYTLEQTQLWADDAVDVEVRFSNYVGWEWTLRVREDHQWQVLDSGTAGSTASALAQAADALVDLAHTYG